MKLSAINSSSSPPGLHGIHNSTSIVRQKREMFCKGQKAWSRGWETRRLGMRSALGHGVEFEDGVPVAGGGRDAAESAVEGLAGEFRFGCPIR